MEQNKLVSQKRVDAAIQVCREIIEYNKRANPFLFSECMHDAVRYLESYKKFCAKQKGRI
jgi:hypothetical protein